jgi:hypothetical protein
MAIGLRIGEWLLIGDWGLGSGFGIENWGSRIDALSRGVATPITTHQSSIVDPVANRQFPIQSSILNPIVNPQSPIANSLGNLHSAICSQRPAIE